MMYAAKGLEQFSNRVDQTAKKKEFRVNIKVLFKSIIIILLITLWLFRFALKLSEIN